jgi:hypothetical protein
MPFGVGTRPAEVCGADHQAHLLEVRHHVADGRRRQIEAGILRQRARADRLAVADIALHQHLQQVPGAIRQVGLDRSLFDIGMVPARVRPYGCRDRAGRQAR